jgi:glyoxylase-like metal-dependent hydrolase (beta-lactamase superfamily II)
VSNNLFVLSGGHYAAIDPPSALGEVYGVGTPGGMILIDCGIPVKGMAIVREALEHHGVGGRVSHLIITHAHFDHAGCAKELQDAGAKIIAGKEDAPCCAAGGLVGTPFGDENIFPAFTPDITIEGDKTLELNGIAFEFIKIPGHTPGSIAVRARIDGKTALFTGDMLALDGRNLNDITFGWQGDPGYHRQTVLESILKLSKYDADMILPGHGKVCMRGGSRLLNIAAKKALQTLR